jgi:hypothetical protein
MASKYYKAYKFLTGGKSKPGIVGVKPKSGGVVDEFKARKLKQLGKTQRRLKSQDKQISTEIDKAKERGATRKQLVKGRKFQRDSRRAQREGDKLRKDVLRIGKAKGGKVDDKKKTKKPLGGKLKKPRPGSYDYQLQETMKPPYKRKEMKKGGKALKPVDKEKNPGLAKLPTHVRNKMGYMKKGGRVRKFGGGKK